MMRADFDYQLTKEEYIVGVTALTDQLGRVDPNRTSRILEQLAVLVAVLAVIIVAFPDALLGVLVATFLIAILQGALRPRWLRGATGHSYDPAVADHHVEVTDDAILVRSALRERRWSWPSVRRIHDLADALVLEFAGWDMLVLPNRLWDGAGERQAFVENLRPLATAATFVGTAGKPASVDARELMTVGAIAAGVDVLALMVFSMPAYTGTGQPLSDPAFVGSFAALILLGLGLAYLAYRFAKPALNRLHDSSPAAATVAVQGLVWAVPLYMLIVYLGWI